MWEPLHHLRWSPSPRGEAFGDGEGLGLRWGWFGRWDPSTAWRRSPSPRGEAFRWGGFGVEVGVVWEVEPLHRLTAVFFPF